MYVYNNIYMYIYTCIIYMPLAHMFVCLQHSHVSYIVNSNIVLGYVLLVYICLEHMGFAYFL